MKKYSRLAIKALKYFLLSLLLVPNADAQRRTEQRYTKTPDLIVGERAWYDVRYYDAHIDSSDSWNTPRFQTALDSAGNDGGGIVYMPRGTWLVGASDSLVVPSNVTVAGAGMGATILSYVKAVTNGHSLFRVDGDSSITFRDFEIDGNAQNDGNYLEFDHGISINNAFRVTVKNMYIRDTGGDGVYVADGDDILIENSIIDVPNINRAAPLVGRNGVAVVEGVGIKIINSIIRGTSFPANIDLEPNQNLNASYVLIQGNTISGGFYAVGLNAGSSGSSLDSVKVFDNFISGTDSMSIRVQDATRFEIKRNTIGYADGSGIQARPGAGMFGEISDNRINNCAGDGILINNATDNLTVNNNWCWENAFSGIRIAGSSGSENKFINTFLNRCWNNDSGDTDTFSGIHINFTDSSIVFNNFCYDDQASPTQHYGINVANCDAIRFKRHWNTVMNNKTSDYNTSGINVDFDYPITLNTFLNPVSTYLFLHSKGIDNVSMALQAQDSGGNKSRYHIMVDTTDNDLFIGGDGNDPPANHLFGIRINTDGLDSLKWDDGSYQYSGIDFDTMTVGDGGTTNYLDIKSDGDIVFNGTAAMLLGSCWGNEIAWTQASAAQDTWYEISDESMSDGQLHGVAHDGSGKLTAATAGLYLCTWTLAGETSAGAGTHLQATFSVSGTETNDGMNHSETRGANAQISMAGTAILDLAASATVEVSLRTTDAGTPNIAVDHLNITIVQIGGT